MEIQTIQKPGLKGTSVIREAERVAIYVLSASVFLPHTLDSYITREVYTEALLSGTQKKTREKFMDELSKLGSEIDVTSDGFRITVQLKTIDTSLEKSLKLFEEMITEPKFDPAELTRITERMKNELLLEKENARLRSQQNYYAKLMDVNDPRHPFEIDAIVPRLKAVTQESIKNFHALFLQSEWCYTTGGSIQTNKLMAASASKLRKTFEPQPEMVHTTFDSQEETKNIVTLLDIPNKQNIEFSIGNALPLKQLDDDFAPLTFGLAVLGVYGGFSGRLMSIVREKEGLTYGIYCGIESATRNETGVWRIMTFFNPRDAVKGLTSTIREVTTICRKGITEDELVRFKAIFRTRFALIEDSLLKKVKESHTQSIMGITEAEYESYKQKIQEVTLPSVNGALKKYIHPKALVISGAGPIENVKKGLENFSYQ